MAIFKRPDKTLTIGGKSVQVRKITIARWRELFGAIQTLPQLLISVLSVPVEQRLGYAITTAEQALDELTRVVAVLTGFDAEWVDENASIDEILSYLTEIYRVNNFGEMLKNAQSVLNLGIPKVAEEQGAE